MTLNHALVTEAPAYTLDGLKREKLEDLATISAIVSEVAECLLFWHRSAHMVHGNIVRTPLCSRVLDCCAP